ncbi:MAG: hypothetical protein HQ564_08710 [Candidatus Saganbacteria bacterium]|nr:hypothetical protein [Candidatus Saganbacteria bacterium]
MAGPSLNSILGAVFGTSGGMNRFVNRFGEMRRINVIMQQHAATRLERFTQGSLCVKAPGHGPNGIYLVTVTANSKMENVLLSLEAATMLADNVRISYESETFKSNESPPEIVGDRLLDYAVAEFVSSLCETLFSICANREDGNDQRNDFGSRVIKHPHLDFTLTFQEGAGGATQFDIYGATSVHGEVNHLNIRRSPEGEKLFVDFELRAKQRGAMGGPQLITIQNCEVAGEHLQSILAPAG